MTEKVKPIGDRLLVEPVDEKETIKGGIIIPDAAKEKPQEGKVVALGTGKIDDNGERTEFVVKVGDRVLFGKYAGTEVKVEEKNYLIMREDDVYAVLG